MIPLRTTLALLLLLAAVLLAAGCTGVPVFRPGETAGISSMASPVPSVSTQATCPPAGHPVYHIAEGESFVYRGTIPDYNGTPVEYLIYSEQSPLYYENLTVEKNGSFVITIDKNQTRQDWETREEVLSDRISSPYDHICVRSADKTHCFDLQIVQNTSGLTTMTDSGWIRIDPVPDQVIPADMVSAYTGNFLVTGTTSLPPGVRLNITLWSLCFLPCPKVLTPGKIGCCGGKYYSGDVGVTEGPCGTSTWSFLVNTSPDRIGMTRVNGRYDDENEFELLVSGQNRTNDDNLWDVARFVVRVQGVP